jgi:hypothetical protein
MYGVCVFKNILEIYKKLIDEVFDFAALGKVGLMNSLLVLSILHF